MSFVIGYATTSKVTIMSDGRLTEKGTCKIKSENYNKTFQFSDTIILGFSGETNICEQAIDVLKMSLCKTFHEVVRYLLLYFEKMNFSNDRHCQFLVGGINEDGHTELDSFGVGIPLKTMVPTTSISPFAALCTETVNGYSIAQRNLLTYKNIDMALKKTIDEVAGIDPTVNTTYFSLSVTR